MLKQILTSNMSKTFKLIIILIFTTYHFSFVFCQFYSEPNFIYRPRKSGTRLRSFNHFRLRKAFEGKDRESEMSDIYTDKFLKTIESRTQPKSFGAQQWQAAVETRPRKKDKFTEMAQNSKQEENVDTSQSEDLSLNILEESAKNLKKSQSEIQLLKGVIRKDKQNMEDRKKIQKALNSETSEQIESEEGNSEQISNYEYGKLSQNGVVEKNNLRGGQHHSKHDKHCAKKCYSPKCEVECVGRQGSAACSANKCKAKTRGSDSAAVCKGTKCLGSCTKDDCIAACEGDFCSVSCEGKICHAVAEGRRTTSECEGDNCVAYAKGHETRPKCKGTVCQTWCVGDLCVAKCRGSQCEAMCSGRDCKAVCVGRNCSQLFNPGNPEPDKPWVFDSKIIKSQAIPISDGKNNLPANLSKDNFDYDGYYGNKKHVKMTINDNDENGVQNNNKGYIDNSGNVSFSPDFTDPGPEHGNDLPYNNNGNGQVMLDYSVAIQLSKQLGAFLKKKVYQMKDLSLLRFLPSLI